LKILGDHDRYDAGYTRPVAILLLGELGPQAKSASAMIRQVMGAGDLRLRQIATLALAKIER
jgi:hypothetical protein